ncbi:hypothetical protein [Erwinia sorbitola]|uniref:Uncharacterized protein n=1 Tax=Erwinia sorbitola TaxID=2681984 RepID=A0ABW9R9G6_9GAMM|nr:hypothetical protein [Erwinia sorbitola]MTD26646.1 hypothetical protein [Erwinia sorbitola]
MQQRLALRDGKYKKYSITLSLILFSTISHGRVVSEIEVKETGIHAIGRNDKYEKKACKVFRPTKKQLIHYFNQAKESEESGKILHEYYSPCLAKGLIKFQDGSSGRWILQSSGFGYVIFSSNQTTYFFHKNNQWTDPYACTYGLSDEIEC